MVESRAPTAHRRLGSREQSRLLGAECEFVVDVTNHFMEDGDNGYLDLPYPDQNGKRPYFSDVGHP